MNFNDYPSWMKTINIKKICKGKRKKKKKRGMPK